MSEDPAQRHRAIAFISPPRLGRHVPSKGTPRRRISPPPLIDPRSIVDIGESQMERSGAAARVGRAEPSRVKPRQVPHCCTCRPRSRAERTPYTTRRWMDGPIRVCLWAGRRAFSPRRHGDAAPHPAPPVSAPRVQGAEEGDRLSRWHLLPEPPGSPRCRRHSGQPVPRPAPPRCATRPPRHRVDLLLIATIQGVMKKY